MTPSEIAEWHGEMAKNTLVMGYKERAFHTSAAATIRAQAEALKIATEALEDCSGGSGGWLRDRATQALARIKEA